MDTNRKKWLGWGAAAIIVVIVGAVAWWMYAHRETAQEIVPGQTLFVPQEGSIVRKFPTELILENGSEIVKSYRIEYSGDNTSQPFARYASGKSFAENADMFRKYFEENHWEMLRMGTADEHPTTFFVGAKNNNEVTVIINEEDGKVEVSITYTLNP